MRCSILKLISLFSIFLYFQNADGQTKAADTLNTATTPKPTSSSSTDNVESRVKSADGDKTIQQVAVLELVQSPVSLFDTNGTIHKVPPNTGRTIKIDRVSLLIKDGYIVTVQAFSGKKMFTNLSAPINISSDRFAKKDYLTCVTETSKKILFQKVVLLTDLLPYPPEDQLIWLDSRHPMDTLTRGVGINSIVDARLYTDALGLFTKIPNGIIKSEINFKQILNRGNFLNKGWRVVNYIKLKFVGSKLDSKNNYVDSSNFSRSQLLQKSTINAELRANLLSGWYPKKTLSNWYWDAGGGIDISRLARSKDTIYVTTNRIFSEVGLNLKTSSNSGVDVYGNASFQYSPETNFQNQNAAVWFIKIGGEFFWNPLDNKASRLFGRMNYFFSTKNKEKKYHFLQVELGYSVLLSKLVNK